MGIFAEINANLELEGIGEILRPPLEAAGLTGRTAYGGLLRQQEIDGNRAGRGPPFLTPDVLRSGASDSSSQVGSPTLGANSGAGAQ